MKQLYLCSYRYRDLDEDALRTLTQRFVEFGQSENIIAHYTRLDGEGGFFVQEIAEDPTDDFERLLRYGAYIEFEFVPVTTIEEAFPVIQRVYG
jgi:hypothetical protein